MLRNLLDHKWRLLGVLAMVGLLVMVRALEETLFYDPLLDYYKADFTALPWPEMDLAKLGLGLTFRYTANALLSVGIIFLIFKSQSLVRFTALLYVLFFVILLTAFFASMAFLPDDKMQLFYIRRFLIQPIFLLLFVPAFYFQQRTSAKK
ncbi:Exosortase F system-associated protein [Flavobacterium longum]|uniref:exosortase F system-associated membrane protein n=1 Tax=Flavobacterium longum TaxID=1299340 RepID=UPI0039EB06A5